MMKSVRAILVALGALVFAAQPCVAQIAISQLPAASTPTGVEVVPAVQAGATRKLSVSQIAAYANTALGLNTISLNTGLLGVRTITYGVTGGLRVLATNPTDGLGSGNFDGGILTQSYEGSDNYQTVSYHLTPGPGLAPLWGPVFEFVGGMTRDQQTNYQRNSLGGLGAYYGPGLNDPVYGGLGAFVINQETGGTKPRLPFMYMVQTNGDASVYYMNQALYFDANGSAQFFRRLDGLAKAQHGNLEVAIGTNEIELGASYPASTGTYDSPQLRIFGNSRDGFGAHTSNWRAYVNVTSNAGASTYRLQSQIDAAGWTDQLTLSDAGVLAATTFSGAGTSLTGTASGLTAGHVSTNANLTGPITSSGNATAVASQTGTGSKFVMDTAPTLVTPALGVATVTTLAVNGCTISTNKLCVTGSVSLGETTVPDLIVSGQLVIATSGNGIAALTAINGTTGAAITLRSVTNQPVTVSSLDTCDSSHDGKRQFVTDATATTFASSVAGSGSNHVPVYCDGSGTPAWKIG